MNNKPSYEELMALFHASNEALKSANEIIAKKDIELCNKNEEIVSKNQELDSKNKIIEQKNKELDEKDAKIRESNLLIQKLLKKLESKDIKLKKQLTERFGIKSDKRSVICANEAEVHASVKFGESHKKKKPGRKPGCKNASKFDMSKIEYREEIIDVENKVCSYCGHTLTETNSLTSYKVDIIPAKIVLTKYTVKQYKCTNCIESNVFADINCFANESFLTPSLGAYIVNSKYNYALPLYRLESILNQLGAPLSRQQICNYSITVAEKLEPIYNRLKEYMIQHNVGVLHADETTLKVIQNSDRKKSYVWLYATTLYDKPIYIYEYQDSREAKHPQEFLKNYKGYLICDDYAGYNNIPNVTPARCWFHAKKRFTELAKVLKPSQRKTSQAVIIDNMISNIFKVEKEECKKKNYTPNKILEERINKLKPLIEEYFKYIKKIYEDCDKKSELGKAIKYSIEIEKDLSQCLEDGHIELSNNLAERGVKPFIILRNNALFANTVNGAEATALLMSVVQTAKMNLLKPDEYIKYVLERIDNIKHDDLDKLLPFAKELPDNLKYNRKDLD